MAATVLGKRHRSAIEPEKGALPLRTTSKRRGRTPQILQKEICQPTSSTVELTSGRRNSTSRRQNGLHAKNALNASSEKVPARCPPQDENVASSTKANSPRRKSTSVNDENVPAVEFKTPQHPRFRDALAASPATPKHRVQVGGSPLTPRTPRQTSSPAVPQTVYAQARRLFTRGANVGQLVGRESEREKLASFVQDAIESQSGGCLYVSGPPGTGKSAMVEEVCNGIDLESVRVAHVNCASMRAARDVYSKLVEIFCDDSQVFKKSETERLKPMFMPTKKGSQLYLVTLDEIDHLLTADAEVLQSLFEWSLHSKSSLILIGIANALDLTDRSLPQLKAKNLKPQLLPFMPYNASQIANVLTSRLRSLVPAGQNPDANFVPFVQPAAIQLCAKKVASQTGDLRKAFELVKRAIDLIEQETISKQEKQNRNPDTPPKTILVENNNLCSLTRPLPSKQGSALPYTVLTAPRASIGHVARITSSAFGQGTVQRLQGLNLQQKAAICALIALDRKRRENEVVNTPSKLRNSAPTIKQIFDTYCALCRNDNILHPLTTTEFKDVLSNLETLGLVGEFHVRGRGGSVAAGSDLRRTPSRSGPGPCSTPSKGLDEQGLVCFVSQREIESQLAGPGEGILRRLLTGQGL